MWVSGLRVLRGPDWRGGDTDGGEGHVGTVLELLGNHRVRVLWDMGQESRCSAGHDGKCELRIFDSAQIGVCHRGTKCAECGDTDVYGMLWRCQVCTGCDLCPLCYHDDKHDVRHQFLRIDTPGSEGTQVTKRKASVKNRALGIFPGSKVTRGKDWQWEDQDGGQGSEGEVTGYENVSPDSSRNLVKVQWPNGVDNTYRLGFYGYVDVSCVEEELGPYYYRDHLPVLDTTYLSSSESSAELAAASSGISLKNTSNQVPSAEADDGICHTSSAQALNATSETSLEKFDEGVSTSKHVRKEDSGIEVDQEKDEGETSFGSPSKGRIPGMSVSAVQAAEDTTGPDEKSADCERETTQVSDTVRPSSEARETTDGEEESFAAGEKVVIKVSENLLMELQEGFGGHTEGMTKATGDTGEVMRVRTDGAVSVRFASSVYTFNPKALAKVPLLKAGLTVRIREAEEELKVLNTRVGWREDMAATVGKVGRVLKIDSEGDVLVSFGRHHFLFAPACCIPAPGDKPDSLRIESGGKLPELIKQAVLSSDSSKPLSGETTNVSKKEAEEMYRVLRERIQSERLTIHGTGDIRALYSAIKNGDHETVREMCLADGSLLEREHQELTPLVGACIEGDSHIAVVRVLLQLGANPNHGLPPFRLPLAAALEGKSEEMVDMLLEAGADPLLVDPKCHTYLHIAAAFDLPKAIQALAARGVDVNVKDDFADTALHVAIDNFKHRAVEALVQVDSIDLSVRNKHDYPPLHQACRRGNARALELMLDRDKREVDAWYHGRSTPLHIAASYDRDECIRLLVLLGGAKVNLQDNVGASYAPLHLACINAKFKAAEALLEMGADVHVQDTSGDTPLHLAIGGRQEDDIQSEAGRQECQLRVAIACMLISNGAYVDMENKKGRNPLSYGVPPVSEGVRRFVEHNPVLVKRKGGGGNLAGSIPSLSGKGYGDLNEALKGMGLPCGLCGAPSSDVMLLPCHHKCVCSACSIKVVQCPLCDEEVKDKEVTGPDEEPLDAKACMKMMGRLK